MNPETLQPAPRVTDEDLIRRFQQGDQAAFDEIVHRFKGPLFNFIYRIIGDAAYAEDLLQETFLRLFLNRDSYREIARFSTWIYTIAGNLAKSEVRRRKFRRWIPLDPPGEDDRPIEVPDPDANPHQILEQRTIQRRVEEEVFKLPRVFKEVIILRDLQELSYEEIGSILKIPLGTVKSRVNRGRERLQKKLRDLL